MLSQALVHLGVGELVLVDDDTVEESNLSRIVGSCYTDIGRSKVLVAKNFAHSIRADVRVQAHEHSVMDASTAASLGACDAIFLAADSMQARHVVNAICNQYLVPGFQVGAKVSSDKDGHITDAFAVGRVIGPSGICMWCRNLILREQLALEALSPALRRQARYVEEVPAPAVITMNMMSTAFALNDFLFRFTGLHEADNLQPRRYHFLTRAPVVEASGTSPRTCLECAGRKAFGSRKRLPVAQR